MLNSRDISMLKPYVRYLCEMLIRKSKAAGIELIVTSTMRDDEYQATLYAQGRTKPGSIVTNRQTVGAHGYGLAFDVAQNIKGQEYDKAVLHRVGQIGKACGLSWGGDWVSFVDYPHFEYLGGLTIEQIKAGQQPKFPPVPGTPIAAEEKIIIQSHCQFSDPNGVWALMDRHAFADALYKKWAESYK